jgi:hypothetical protein
MAEGVVDELEVVEVDQQQRDGPPVRLARVTQRRSSASSCARLGRPVSGSK